MQTASHITTNHDEIKSWVESRGGWPASVMRTKGELKQQRIRIHLPERDENVPLEKIPWEAFFRKFDNQELAFVYQEQEPDGSQSRFFKIVKRNRVPKP